MAHESKQSENGRNASGSRLPSARVRPFRFKKTVDTRQTFFSSHRARRKKRNHSGDEESSSEEEKDKTSQHQRQKRPRARKSREETSSHLRSHPGGIGYRDLSPETAFRESVHDAMADSEGASYWEGVFGQPIHEFGSAASEAAASTRARPSHSREGSGGGDGHPDWNGTWEDELASYVRRRMWERSQQAAEEERQQRRRDFAETESQRTRARRGDDIKMDNEHYNHYYDNSGGQTHPDPCLEAQIKAALDTAEKREREKKRREIWSSYIDGWEKVVAFTNREVTPATDSSATRSPSPELQAEKAVGAADNALGVGTQSAAGFKPIVSREAVVSGHTDGVATATNPDKAMNHKVQADVSYSTSKDKSAIESSKQDSSPPNANAQSSSSPLPKNEARSESDIGGQKTIFEKFSGAVHLDQKEEEEEEEPAKQSISRSTKGPEATTEPKSNFSYFQKIARGMKLSHNLSGTSTDNGGIEEGSKSKRFGKGNFKFPFSFGSGGNKGRPSSSSDKEPLMPPASDSEIFTANGERDEFAGSQTTKSTGSIAPGSTPQDLHPPGSGQHDPKLHGPKLSDHKSQVSTSFETKMQDSKPQDRKVVEPELHSTGLPNPKAQTAASHESKPSMNKKHATIDKSSGARPSASAPQKPAVTPSNAASAGVQAPSLPWPCLTGKREDLTQESIREFFKTVPAAFERHKLKLSKRPIPANIDLRPYLKTERVRWHPDRIMRILGPQFIDGDIIKAVTLIFQVVDTMWKESRVGRF